MKIWPRSVAGTNSSPTTPSGTSEIEATNVAEHAMRTSQRFASAHGSARRAYQSRMRSKPFVNQSTIRGGLHSERSAHKPASVGVTVNETNSEVSVEMTTTMANSAS